MKNLTPREAREARVFSTLLVAVGLLLGLLTLNEYLTFGTIDGGATPLWLALSVWTGLPCLLGLFLTRLLSGLKAWDMRRIRNARWKRVQARRDADLREYNLSTWGVPFRPAPVTPRGSRRY